MTRRSILTGSVALMILMASLFLASPAQAYVQNCDSYVAGTQAFAECMVRAEDREAAPIVPPSEQLQQQGQPTTTTVVESSSTSLGQLALAGLAGALIALGGTMAVVRLGQRERVTAH